ncbi:MAG: DUF1015 domain-containing protein [Methanomicrobiales archaeon]|nr:DUF1015 domain-containing protein [Methanomicrobiales archaeon]
MVRIYRFAGVRPERSEAQAIAAVPYDVVTKDEARTIISKNPRSFLRVSRTDAELVNIPVDDPRIYERAKENFEELMKSGEMLRDPEPGMYLYRVRQNDEEFLGLCCCLDVDDYRNTSIRRHELTRYDKEEDRTRHIGTTKTHNGPVVLLYRDSGNTFAFIKSLISPQTVPDAEVKGADGGIHQIYRITDASALDRLEKTFADIPALYIADGHHRAKSAVNVADRRIVAGLPADGEVSRFMGVMFAHNRVRIHGYSRLLVDLGTFSHNTFLENLAKYFEVKPYGRVNGREFNIRPKCTKPENYHIVHMYLGGEWYECTRPVDKKAKPLDALDVAVLQTYVLEGLLGISDPRGDARLQYLGGARPVADLEKLVDMGEYQLAFAMQPVKVDTVLSIADAGGVMPPKSTWFEPKLLSGLVVHTFD